MQATLDGSSLKPFTRALTCLSKYGDDLSITATPNTLAFTTTNQSMSAYARFKFERQFFSKYRVHNAPATTVDDDIEKITEVKGQLLAKSILSVLRHSTIEKTVERCELSIIEGTTQEEDNRDTEEADSLESKLIVRLHCKHGVVKTHRLLLQCHSSLLSPGDPDGLEESRLTIASRSVKDMLEHFSATRGKSDPQLIWTFDLNTVEIKSAEAESKGKIQLFTELTISTEEFDAYDMRSPPTRIAFHQREFGATIAFAESMALPLDLRFTDPASPLFIDVESDNCVALFVISTSQAHGADALPTNTNNSASTSSGKKREREESARPVPVKKPMKVVHRVPDNRGTPNAGPSRAQSRALSSMPPPSFPASAPRRSETQEPLFLPASSQLSVADAEELRATGLGIEHMSADEFMNMMDGDGEEVAVDLSQRPASQFEYPPDVDMHAELEHTDSFDLIEDAELAPTQDSDVNMKTFRPLFED